VAPNSPDRRSDAQGSHQQDLTAGAAGERGGGAGTVATKVQLTGRVSVQHGSASVEEQCFCGRQARLVFALLVIERARPVHRDELAEALWPHRAPRTWEVILRGVISKVRVFLAAVGWSRQDTLVGGFGAYQLRLPAGAVVDVEDAFAAVEGAEQALGKDDLNRAAELAEAAQAVAARPFLSGEEGAWVDRVRARLREVCLRALLVRGESHVRQDKYGLAVGAAEEAVALEPFRERAYQLLMRAYAGAGSPGEALRVYERCRRLLAEELGVDPSFETEGCYLALLGGQRRDVAPILTTITR